MKPTGQSGGASLRQEKIQQMMQQMRRSVKWVIGLVMVAFVGLMVFEWGMDITGQTSGSLGEIGRVNGIPVMYEDYMAAYRNIYDFTQEEQEEPITEALNKELEDEAFQEIVDAILISQELGRRGIVVTDDEVLFAARSSAPPFLAASPAFQTEGSFDLSKYQQFLASVDNLTLLQIEAYFRNTIPRVKLTRQLASGIHVSDAELWMLYRDANERSSVRYLALSPELLVEDDSVSVSEDEADEYYRDNREDFLVPASAWVISTAFLDAPTAQDTAAAWERARGLVERVRDGEAFADVAQSESDAQNADETAGSMGVLAKGMAVPALDSLLFAAPVGAPAGPVATSFGLHLVQVAERWSQDSVSASQILVEFRRTDESEIAMLTLADSLEDLGEVMPLSEAAAVLDLPADTVEILETGPWVPLPGTVQEGGEWAFDPETLAGDVSPVFQNRIAYYAFELISKDTAAYTSREEADQVIRNAISSEKKLSVAREMAREIRARIDGGLSLDEAAEEAGMSVLEPPPFTRSQSVAGIGGFNSVVGAAFGLRIGEVSDVLTSFGNLYIVERTASEPADSMAWLEGLEAQRENVVAIVRQSRVQQWLAALREGASIVDRREEVLQPADEEQLPQLPPVF